MSEDADVARLRALGALGDLELDPLVLVEAAVAVGGDRGEVDEDVVTAAVDGDEAEALVTVEPLHSALCHVLLLLRSAGPHRATPPAVVSRRLTAQEGDGNARGTRFAGFM